MKRTVCDIHTGSQDGAAGATENGISRSATMPRGRAGRLRMQMAKSKFKRLWCRAAVTDTGDECLVNLGKCLLLIQGWEELPRSYSW